MEEQIKRQMDYFDKFTRAYLAALEPSDVQHMLLARIATARLTIEPDHDVFNSLAVAQMHDPDMLVAIRKKSAADVQRIKEEATDPDLALLHWEAAQGLALSALLGLCPLLNDERDRLFDRLRAETQKT